MDEPSLLQAYFPEITDEPQEPPVPWQEINDINPDHEDDDAVQHQVHMHNRREMIQRARETRARLNHEERVRIREDRRARTEGYRRASIRREERRAIIRAEEEMARFLEADQRTRQMELAQERGRARLLEEEQVDDQADVAVWGQLDQQTIANRGAEVGCTDCSPS